VGTSSSCSGCSSSGSPCSCCSASRRWVYASAKKENNHFAFGTDDQIESTRGYVLVKHSTLGCRTPASTPEVGMEVDLPCAKVLGGPRGRRQAFRPQSVVDISGMSFGALSGAAIEALNRGAALAGCLHNTGEGGLSPYHRKGGDLVFQIGTAYFGVRDEQGRFDLARLKDVVVSAPVRAIDSGPRGRLGPPVRDQHVLTRRPPKEDEGMTPEVDQALTDHASSVRRA
jgi:hypothetical protein